MSLVNLTTRLYINRHDKSDDDDIMRKMLRHSKNIFMEPKVREKMLAAMEDSKFRLNCFDTRYSGEENELDIEFLKDCVEKIRRANTQLNREDQTIFHTEV